MVSISSMNASSPEPQNPVQNNNLVQKTSDDNIWSKYDDNKDGVINIADTSSVKPIYDQIMQKIETLSEKIKSSFQASITSLFQEGKSYNKTAEDAKIADNSFESSRQTLENRINLAVEFNNVQPDQVMVHPKDNSIVQVKKDGESVIIVPMNDGKYITYRQNSEALPESKNEREGYSEIEHKEYNSISELKEDMASESYGWGRTTLRQNHPDKKSKQDLSLVSVIVKDSFVDLVGYDKFDK